jgi:hypothetical protein
MSTSPLLVITNFFGMHVNAANAGMGIKNPDGSTNVSGTVIGVGQTAHATVDFALTGSGKLTTRIPVIGALLGAAAALDSYSKITTALTNGQSPAQSDVAGVVGGVASIVGGAALILGGGVIVPISVIAGLAAGTWQMVASAKSWTLDDAGFPTQKTLSDTQKTEVTQTLQDLSTQTTYTDALGNLLGGGSIVPATDSNLWGSPQAFEPQSALSKSVENAIDQAMQAARNAGKSAQQAIDSITETLSSWGDNLVKLINGDGNNLNLQGGNEALISELQNLYNTAQQANVRRGDPLALDLDGDGVVETTALSKSTTTGTHFNLDAKGLSENTGWVSADDGLLVRDLNSDGQITSGRELFGNHTLLSNGQEASNGFEALQALDSNADGVINAADQAFASLQVWKDADGDGVTDAGELLSLEQAGVSSLNVSYTTGSTTDAQGNQHLQLGSYTTTSGASRNMDDVWFATDSARTQDRETVVVSDAIAALPDLAGMGNVRGWAV